MITDLRAVQILLFIYFCCCFPVRLTAQEETLQSDPILFPPQRAPVEPYLKRGLIPRENGMDAVRRLSDQPADTAGAVRRFSASGTWDLDLTTATRVSNGRIILSNTGTTNIVNPWVVANNRRNWYSCASIVQEAVGGETNPELRAFRIWDLIKRGRYHWSPAEAANEVHSPVKYLNVYGYGLCDDSATVLECLWKQAGFTQARCWGMEGHVISEVYYGGAWHVLDADVEVFYPEWSGTGVAGYSQLAADGPLVSRLTPDYTGIYVSTNDNTTYQRWYDSAYTMAMTLRPGESLERCHYNWGKYHDNLYHEKPPFFGNGRLTWQPDLSSPASSSPGFTARTNVQWNESPDEAVPLVTVADPAQPAEIVWQMKSPYVFVGGSLNVHVRVPGSSSSAAMYFRKPGQAWSLLGSVSGPFDGWTTVSLDTAIAPTSSNACYAFDLKVTMNAGGEAGNRVGIDALSATGEIQCNPRSLPSLVPGQVNQIATTFSGGAGGGLEVAFEWTERDDVPPVPVPQAPVEPASGAAISTTTPVLSWESGVPGETDLWREVVVSWDPGGYHPVSPATAAVGPIGTSHPVTAGWLLPNHTYYWRVREGDELSAWSPTWSFSVGEVTPVTVSSWTVE